MSSLLPFVIGVMIGGIVMMIVMCSLQINRINELEERYTLNKMQK